MELLAVTGQLYIVNGEAYDSSSVPGLLAKPEPSDSARGRTRDSLFTHLTLSGPLEETTALAHDLVDSIYTLFFETPGSVTAALRKSIIETNKLLLGQNLSGANKSREGAITCAVQRGEELYMAQVGEGFALLGHNFGVERIPPGSSQKITPLGRTAGLNIQYSHHWLTPGDMLLLADPRLGHLQASALDTVLIDSDIEEGLQELANIVGSDSARLILIEFADEPPENVPDAVVASTLHESGKQLLPPTGEPMRQSAPASTVPFSTVDTGSPSASVDVVETKARKATSQAAKSLSTGTGWLASLLAKLRPPREREDEFTGWALPAFLAILIPLLVTAVVTAVYIQRGQATRVREIKRELDVKLNEGQQAGDPELAATYYLEALELADEGLDLRPGDDEIVRKRLEAQIELDGVVGIGRLGARLLYQYEEGTSLESVVLGDELNGDIYVLDVANNQVYRHKTGEDYVNLDTLDPELVLFDEQVVGSHVVGQIIDTLWRPRGTAVTRDGIGMLDTRGALVSFYPNLEDWRAVDLGMSSDWHQPKSIASFNERLYVLDTGSATIWRYFAEGDGFTISDEQRAIEFVEDADLSQAVDFAIYSEDGSIVILYGDGRMRRYANGRLLWGEDGLGENGLEMPLAAPVAVKIAGQGLNSSIFVLDAGSGRVVQFSLGGTFLAQFKATNEFGNELFDTAADFEVAENPLRIFVIAGNGLYISAQE